MNSFELEKKAKYVFKETLLLHKRSPETRVASSLSAIEILCVLYYRGILRYFPDDIANESRDRFIISKGHGSISLYPILADLGYIKKEELLKISQTGAILGSIPDPVIPGYETVNGSLGHGPGLAAGIAMGLKIKNNPASVYTIVGDGELNEGSVWEAVQFIGHHKLDNLICVIDNNGAAMLDFSKNIIDLGDIAGKFEAFGWKSFNVDGHDMNALSDVFSKAKDVKGAPVVIVADTVKGRGVTRLEESHLSHILSMSADEIDCILEGMDD